MSVRTPWTQSSVLSDRVKPRSQANSTLKNKGKGKDTSTQEPLKSPAARQLETVIKNLQSEPGSQKDAKGGCFCLARTHDLSPYTPICTRCGLILCSLNAPCYACPHCSTPLLSPSAKEALLDRLQRDLASTIAKEEEEAERVREEARQAAGAFPSLSRANSPSLHQQQPQQPQTHKVLSLNSKTKRVTVASYTKAPPVTKSSGRSEASTREPSPERIPPPPQELPVAKGLPDPARPWLDMRSDGFVRMLTYVRDPRSDREQLKEERKARKASKKKEKEGVVDRDTSVAVTGVGESSANP